jgi:hypothetical protein
MTSGIEPESIYMLKDIGPDYDSPTQIALRKGPPFCRKPIFLEFGRRLLVILAALLA